jgi:hypothetical protein
MESMFPISSVSGLKMGHFHVLKLPLVGANCRVTSTLHVRFDYSATNLVVHKQKSQLFVSAVIAQKCAAKIFVIAGPVDLIVFLFLFFDGTPFCFKMSFLCLHFFDCLVDDDIMAHILKTAHKVCGFPHK